MRRETRGDVLMEYVLVTVLVLTPLVGLELYGTEAIGFNGKPLFNPAGASAGDLGIFGQKFVEWYQRILCGVSLPVP